MSSGSSWISSSSTSKTNLEFHSGSSDLLNTCVLSKWLAPNLTFILHPLLDNILRKDVFYLLRYYFNKSIRAIRASVHYRQIPCTYYLCFYFSWHFFVVIAVVENYTLNKHDLDSLKLLPNLIDFGASTEK